VVVDWGVASFVLVVLLSQKHDVSDRVIKLQIPIVVVVFTDKTYFST
jgi:hypothetical protein